MENLEAIEQDVVQVRLHLEQSLYAGEMAVVERGIDEPSWQELRLTIEQVERAIDSDGYDMRELADSLARLVDRVETMSG